MKRKSIATGTLALTLLFLSSCGGAGGNPANVAKQFMDRYYVQANVQEAKALATPAMAQKMEEQFAILAKVVPMDQGKSHEVSYTLSEQVKDGKHAYYNYEIVFKPKEGDPIHRRATLSVDVVDGDWRITQFDESASQPSETIRH